MRVHEDFQRNHAVLDAAAGRGQENPVTSSTLRDSGGGVGPAAASDRVKDPRQLLHEAFGQVPLEKSYVDLSFVLLLCVDVEVYFSANFRPPP
jgi:hypothetical protein